MEKPSQSTINICLNVTVPNEIDCATKRGFWFLRHAVLTAMLATLVAMFGEAQAESSSEFDIEMLKARGIDPKLAEYFREATRFTEGRHIVTLVVNGVKLGKVEAQFDKTGQLCYDNNLLTKGHMIVPSSRHALSSKVPAHECYDFVSAYPQTEASLRPNKDEVFLVVPQEALLRDAPQASEYSNGGAAGLYNYDVMALRSEFAGQSHNYLSGSTELGFNLSDWIVRSRQQFTQHDSKTNSQHLYAYAQRTFTEQKAVLQAGQININSPLFAGTSITGVQIQPEAALLRSAISGALVEGIAYAQSTLEVRQSGILIFTTIVPEGPFSLSDIPLLSSRSDLDVTMRDITGAERHFTVPAASYRDAVAVRPGYTFSVGKVRKLGSDDQEQPWVVTGTGAWSIRDTLTATTGLLAAYGYQSVGWGTDASLARDTSMSVRNVYSSAQKENLKGAQASVSLRIRLSEVLSTSVSATQQTIGYRDLSDTTSAADGYWHKTHYQSQYSASLGWSDKTLGSFNVSVAPTRTFQGDTTNRLISSWGQTFKHATVSASVETALSGSAGYGGDNAAYISVSIPLGKSRSMRTYVNRRGDTQRIGTTYSEVVNDQLNYRLSTEKSGNQGGYFSSANLSAIPRYTSLDLGYSQGTDSKNYNVRISGGAVAHKDGVTFSPYPVQDTFGIVGVGDLSGVKVSTPYGPVWTDYNGKAVVPMLSAYKESRIEVQTNTLPRRVDLQNGFQTVGAGRGSVNHMAFKVIKAQRVLVTATDVTGRLLPKGASVLDSKNNFLTTVLDKGTIFLSDTDPTQVLKVSLPDESVCLLTINLPRETDDDTFYETAPGVCYGT